MPPPFISAENSEVNNYCIHSHNKQLQHAKMQLLCLCVNIYIRLSTCHIQWTYLKHVWIHIVVVNIPYSIMVTNLLKRKILSRKCVFYRRNYGIHPKRWKYASACIQHSWTRRFIFWNVVEPNYQALPPFSMISLHITQIKLRLLQYFLNNLYYFFKLWIKIRVCLDVRYPLTEHFWLNKRITTLAFSTKFICYSVF